MGKENNTRWAVVVGPPATIQRYMPGNYKVVGFEETDDTIYTFIEGIDLAGWTLDEYVRPRLESGLYFGLSELRLDPMSDDTVAHDGIKPWPVDE